MKIRKLASKKLIPLHATGPLLLGLDKHLLWEGWAEYIQQNLRTFRDPERVTLERHQGNCKHFYMLQGVSHGFFLKVML